MCFKTTSTLLWRRKTSQLVAHNKWHQSKFSEGVTLCRFFPSSKSFFYRLACFTFRPAGTNDDKCDESGTAVFDNWHFLKKTFFSIIYLFFFLWFLQPCRAASWMGRRPTSTSAWSSPRPCPPSASGVSCPARTTVSWPTGPSSRPAPPTAWASAPGRGRWSVGERKKNEFCC